MRFSTKLFLICLLFSSLAYADQPPLEIKDEGVSQGRPAYTLDCVGAGIACSRSGITGTITVGGSSGSPGGSDTQVQFNDSSSFGGDAGFTFIKATDSVDIGGNLAVGGSGAISAVKLIDAAKTYTTAATDLYGSNISIVSTPSADSSNNTLHGQKISLTDTGASNPTQVMEGLTVEVGHSTTGADASSLTGVKSVITNTSSTTSSALIGFSADVSSSGTGGTFSSLIGSQQSLRISNSDLGAMFGNYVGLTFGTPPTGDATTTTDAYGYFLSEFKNQDNIVTNSYGYYVESLEGTNRYQFYGATADPSYLGGNLELGNISDTTIARASAGVVSVEGVNLLTTATGQPLDSTLTSLAAYNTNGLLTQTAADTFTGRTLTEGLALDVTNGDGVSGNPTVAFDPTELTGSRTFGDASTDTIVWTFNRATGTDPTITALSGGIGVQSLTNAALTSGRVLIAGASGLLADDSDMTFSTDTLTITKIAAYSLTGLMTLAANILYGENTEIQLDAALSADGKYCGVTEVVTAGETIAFGDVVYLKAADSQWYLTDADADATAGAVRVAIAVTSGTDNNTMTVLKSGKIRADANFPALTVGAPVYISTGAGDVQTAQPSATDDVIRIVGYGNTGDEMDVSISNDYMTHT